jgi:CRISPR-associated endonuclease/helicase Cas3
VCYPTTGTATEGFKDYLHNPDAEHNYRLFHGRADVDLAGLLPVRGDEPNAEADAAARLEALDAWGTPVVSCTVDTVLGLVQNSRRGLFAWPALAGAAFVFDEIHAYDDRLFGALLRFLQALPGAPVLLMTASLPKARRAALNDCLKRAKRPPVNEVPGPDDLEKRPRYTVEPPSADVAGRVRQEVAAGGKVLWVCNTVKRAMAAASSLPGSLVYHSRFRYCDRVDRHREVVAAFKPDHPGGVVACCTQVAEMSLDLEGTTLLVTELAPVPALIQRLGRLNRDARDGDPPRPFIVIDVGDDHLPYTPDESAAAQEWLKALGTGPLSQRDLAEAWQKHDAGRKPDFVASAWLDGGPSTPVLELREASPGITVVLAADAAEVKAGRRKLAEVAIPMPPPPKGLNWREWDLLRGGVPVAPADAITYDPKGGAEWVAPGGKG